MSSHDSSCQNVQSILNKAVTFKFNNIRAFFLLFFFTFLLYSNSFQAAWQFDDKQNIVNNEAIHVSALSPDSLFSTFFAKPRTYSRNVSDIYRPIACLTFGFNWYFCRDNVFGYHLVNTLVHVLTAFFAFLLIRRLYESPRLKSHSRENTNIVALAAVLLWAAHPIQTQAVTYIVQRMASMAAMFYLSALYFFVRAKTTDISHQKILMSLLVLISFFLSLGCKENAITLPLAILLIDFTFFNEKSFRLNTKSVLFALTTLFILLTSVILIIFLRERPLDIFSYQSRSFTLTQRLITQPRVILFYLSLIFLPSASRLSIEHDFSISTSWNYPWTTLPSFFAILALIGFGFYSLKKRPILGFGILFFFLAHLVESSILPLEMVFEHRNYLPSIFLFWPISYLIISLIKRYKNVQPLKSYICIAFLFSCMGWMGVQTYIRNLDWQTPERLWMDALEKAPNSARATTMVGLHVYQKAGDWKRAKEYYLAALKKESSSGIKTYVFATSNLASIYFFQKKYREAINIYLKGIAQYGDNDILNYNLAMAYRANREWIKANNQLDILLSRSPKHPKFNLSKGSLLIDMNRPKEALSFLAKASTSNALRSQTSFQLGRAFYVLGNYIQSEKAFENSLSRSGFNAATLVWLILLNDKLKDDADLSRYRSELFLKQTPQLMDHLLQQLSDPNQLLHSEKERLIHLLSLGDSSRSFNPNSKNKHVEIS